MFVMGSVTSCLLLDTVFSHLVVLAGFGSVTLYAVQKILRNHTAAERYTVVWLLLTAAAHCVLSRGHVYGHREMRGEAMTPRQAIGAVARWAESPLRVRDCFIDPVRCVI